MFHTFHQILFSKACYNQRSVFSNCAAINGSKNTEFIIISHFAKHIKRPIIPYLIGWETVSFLSFGIIFKLLQASFV